MSAQKQILIQQKCLVPKNVYSKKKFYSKIFLVKNKFYVQNNFCPNKDLAKLNKKRAKLEFDTEYQVLLLINFGQQI